VEEKSIWKKGNCDKKEQDYGRGKGKKEFEQWKRTGTFKPEMKKEKKNLLIHSAD